MAAAAARAALDPDRLSFKNALVIVRRHLPELAAGLRLIECSMREGMLVLWDRGFHSFKTLDAILKQKAQFLGRVKTTPS